MTEAEKLELCTKAITHIAVRMRTDDKLRYLMGFGTEAYSRLSVALGAVSGTTKEHAGDWLLGIIEDL
jgi:hypothetical protein